MLTYFPWHYTIALSTLLTIFRNLLFFLYHFFSIPQLFKTLFSPWKKETVRYEGPGFNLGKYFEVLIFNLLSQIIGGVVRTLTIFFGLFTSFFFLLASFLILAIFLVLPFVSLPFYLEWQREKAENLTEIIKKFGLSSETLFKKIFTGPFSDFLFRRLEIGPKDYQLLFEAQNQATEEKRLQEALLQVKPLLTDVVSLFCQYFSPLANLLREKNIDPKDFIAVAQWWERQKKEEEFNRRFWELTNLQKIKCLGKDWTFGFTVNLDKFSQDLNYEAKTSPKLIGRNKETEAIERILSKKGENNVLIVGEPGVGKKTIVLGLAQRIAWGKTTPGLSHKRVLLFDLNLAIAQEKTIEEKRAKLLTLFKEAKEAGNIILAITSFDKYICDGPGRVDLTQAFSQGIGGSSVQIIGITTPEDYRRYILSNPTILRLFETVEVFPPTKEEALLILEDLVPVFEQDRKILISFFAVTEIIEKSDLLVTEVPFPEKAINLLDEAVVFALNNLKVSFLTKKMADQLLSLKTKIPLTEITKTEKEKLLNLEDFLHQRIIDQEEAIEALGKAMRRGRVGVGKEDKPISSFLFLGPTGVGKTETAKALASLYFGSEAKMVRFDMAEFVGTVSVEKLIGETAGRPGLLTSAVRESPFSVLLLDEFEKTTPEVLNLFLTVLDEGYLKDGSGKFISFKNLIIIATSNAGAEFIREKVKGGIGSEELSKTLVEYILRERIFSPELINRFDGIVVFKPLTLDHLRKIAQLMLRKLNERLKKEHGITVEVTPEIIDKIATLGFDPTFGARPMARVIQEKVEEPVARMILEGKARKGETLKIKLSELENYW